MNNHVVKKTTASLIHLFKDDTVCAIYSMLLQPYNLIRSPFTKLNPAVRLNALHNPWETVIFFVSRRLCSLSHLILARSTVDTGQKTVSSFSHVRCTTNRTFSPYVSLRLVPNMLASVRKRQIDRGRKSIRSRLRFVRSRLN